MKLGAEPKKVAALAVALVVLALVLYFEVFSGDSEPAPVARTAVPVAVVPSPKGIPVGRGGRASQAAQRSTSNRTGATAWNLRQGSKNPEDRPDPASIDPTLHMELLAKVQNVEVGPPGRNLFVFGAAPPPTAAKVELPKGVPKIPITPVPGAPGPMTVASGGPPPPPAAPQMTFKYYGYKKSKSDGHKAAFLLDGDDILIAGENDTFKARYKVVRIGDNSITIEDTQFKSQQTLPLQENAAG